MSMDSVTLKGSPITLKGDVPMAGIPAADFTFVLDNLSEQSLYDIEDKIKVIIGVPSLDTGVCQVETRKFSERLQGKDGVIGLVISKDLPFAMKRFCEAEGIDNVIIASDYRYGDFVNEYNTEMITGPLKGLSARAVFVVDKNNNLKYTQLVPEIGQEPDYDEVMEAVENLQ